jgi:hypothetical protein
MTSSYPDKVETIMKANSLRLAKLYGDDQCNMKDATSQPFEKGARTMKSSLAVMFAIMRVDWRIRIIFVSMLACMGLIITMMITLVSMI